MIFNKMIFLYNDPTDYLCFTSPNSFSVSMFKVNSPDSISLEYSNDKISWTEFIAGTTTISANSNEKIYFRGNNTRIGKSENDYWIFQITGTDVRASGNIMSLLDKTCESTSISSAYCFESLFSNCTSLTTGPSLPATTLANNCYQNMFGDCSSLIAAPALPATVLKNKCYQGMFGGCSALTTAPALSATSLAYGCYNNMFWCCTALIAAPSLPATTLAESCYDNMFATCTSLITPPALPATTLAKYCYAYMFHGCTSLKVYSYSGSAYSYAWNIPTSGTASSYKTQDYMFYNCPGSYKTATSVTLNQTFYTQNEPV